MVAVTSGIICILTTARNGPQSTKCSGAILAVHFSLLASFRRQIFIFSAKFDLMDMWNDHGVTINRSHTSVATKCVGQGSPAMQICDAFQSDGMCPSLHLERVNEMYQQSCVRASKSHSNGVNRMNSATNLPSQFDSKWTFRHPRRLPSFPIIPSNKFAVKMQYNTFALKLMSSECAFSLRSHRARYVACKQRC